MPIVHVVADDLTGACDTGHELARRGYDTVVRLDQALDVDPTVLVDDTDSRYVAPEEAHDRVADVVAKTTADVRYKKVDSTLRGNLGPEIGAAIDADGAEAALVAPALPSNGRLTACGIHLVNGRLVTETDPGLDPESPVTSANLPSLLSSEGHEVEHVPIDQVASGADALAPTLAAAVVGAEVVTADAVDDHNLSTLAATAASIDPAVVYVGSGGLARHLEVAAAPTPTDEIRLTMGEGRSFATVGSVNEITLTQVATVPDDRVVQLDAALAVADPDAAIQRAIKTCLDRFESEPSIVLASAIDEHDVAASFARADEVGVSRATAKRRVAGALAAVTADVLADAKPSGLFLSGGAVAAAVLEQLSTRGLRLSGQRVGAGIPVSTVIGGDADGLTAVTKAGGFGGPNALADALEVL